jgi:hypothetical protein
VTGVQTCALPIWNEDQNHSVPAPLLGSLHLMIDRAGRGHLWAMDAGHLWHLGPPVLGAKPIAAGAIPETIALSAFPNPFNSAIQIRFSLQVTGQTELSLYDVLGRKVANLVDGVVEAGNHELRFEASKLCTGVYFMKLTSNSRIRCEKVLLVR